MATNEIFFFETKAKDPDSDPEAPYSFEVVRFSGTEGVSKLYRFEIYLASTNPDVDLGLMLRNQATLYLSSDKTIKIHGILAGFEQLNEAATGHYYYKAVLVPGLWRLTQKKESKLFIGDENLNTGEKTPVDTGTGHTIPSTVKAVLNAGGFVDTDDYQLTETVDKAYWKWAYLTQYQESPFDFISRLMEREGLYYYFEQGDEKEKLVITDNGNSLLELPGMASINYGATSGGQSDIVTSFICRQKPLPNKVILHDFNSRFSTKVKYLVQGQAVVSSTGDGDVHVYGEDVKTSDEAGRLATIRSEEILCREKVFYGESDVPELRPGYYLGLQSHYRTGYNQQYLLLDVGHQASQAAVLTWLPADQREPGEDVSFYNNTFEAIPFDDTAAVMVKFRPERKTPWPRFYGSMNAKVTGPASVTDPHLDAHGRYRVELPIDTSGNVGNTASRPVRMAQPNAGVSEGVHMPLRPNAEVLLTFIDGDLNRPVISGAVPGETDFHPVTSTNAARDQFLLKTHQGHQVIMDKEGTDLRAVLKLGDIQRVAVGPAPGPEAPEAYNYPFEVWTGGASTGIGDCTANFHSAANVAITGDKSAMIAGGKLATILLESLHSHVVGFFTWLMSTIVDIGTESADSAYDHHKVSGWKAFSAVFRGLPTIVNLIVQLIVDWYTGNLMEDLVFQAVEDKTMENLKNDRRFPKPGITKKEKAADAKKKPGKQLPTAPHFQFGASLLSYTEGEKGALGKILGIENLSLMHLVQDRPDVLIASNKGEIWLVAEKAVNLNSNKEGGIRGYAPKGGFLFDKTSLVVSVDSDDDKAQGHFGKNRFVVRNDGKKNSGKFAQLWLSQTDGVLEASGKLNLAVTGTKPGTMMTNPPKLGVKLGEHPSVNMDDKKITIQVEKENLVLKKGSIEITTDASGKIKLSDGGKTKIILGDGNVSLNAGTNMVKVTKDNKLLGKSGQETKFMSMGKIEINGASELTLKSTGKATLKGANVSIG
jgi:type VI secretion system VgrG family protein